MSSCQLLAFSFQPIWIIAIVLEKTAKIGGLRNVRGVGTEARRTKGLGRHTDAPEDVGEARIGSKIVELRLALYEYEVAPRGDCLVQICKGSIFPA
jgi:hypothetical protein